MIFNFLLSQPFLAATVYGQVGQFAVETTGVGGSDSGAVDYGVFGTSTMAVPGIATPKFLGMYQI